MLKSTAYLRPCSVRQQKTLPLRQEGVPEGEGVCLCCKVTFCKVVYYNEAIKQIINYYKNGNQKRDNVRFGSEHLGNNGDFRTDRRRGERDVVNAATSLAESLSVKLNVVEDVNEITDPNNTMQRAKRGAKAWYDVDTDQVYFVAPNATSIQDAEESILNADSIIFVWLLITSPTLSNTKMSE